MNEPTKEAIEEARTIALNYAMNFYLDQYYTIRISPRGLAVMLADVRKKAREDALDRAITFFSKGFDKYQNLHVDYIAEKLEAMKDQPSGEQP